MKIKLINGEWKQTETDDKDGIYIDGFLFEKIMNVKKIIKKGWDCIVLIDGVRRGGKSTLATLMAYVYSDGKMGINNYGRGMVDSAIKIKNLPNGAPLIIDEGSLVFSSKDALAREQKKLMKIIDVCGQKNLFMIIVLPFVFELNYSIVSKSRFIIHIYTDEQLNRGRFGFWGEKKIAYLYSHGKKNFYTYSKPDVDFLGRYTIFHPPFYKEYLELKKKVMLEALEGEKEIKMKWHQKHFITGAQNLKKMKFTQKRIAELFDCSAKEISRTLNPVDSAVNDNNNKQ